jgi:hypothetical protein
MQTVQGCELCGEVGKTVTGLFIVGNRVFRGEVCEPGEGCGDCDCCGKPMVVQLRDRKTGTVTEWPEGEGWVECGCPEFSGWLNG